MRYKNIIFDFGNVIGKFKGDYILGKFASTPEDYDILADAILSSSLYFIQPVLYFYKHYYSLIDRRNQYMNDK